MIPGSLTAPPAPVRAGGPTAGGVARAVGALLLVAALAGASAWYLVYSPFSFRRWSTLEVVPELVIKDPGTYVLFEEFPGAADATAPSDITVALTSIGGRRISGTSMVGPDGHSRTTYHSPFHDGRAITSFVIDRPGTYRLVAFTSGAGVTAANAPKLALAPDGRPGWAGSTVGLLVLVLVPLTAGVTLLLVARRRWPRLESEPERAPLDHDAWLDDQLG